VIFTFTSPLDVRHLRPGNEWKLLADLTAAVICDDAHTELLVVPEGFITDFASVPRIPIFFELFGDVIFDEPAVHDWLYSTGDYPREWCDSVFLAAMLSTGVDPVKANLMYDAVREFGESHYHHKGN
jgi:hypothetical protein